MRPVCCRIAFLLAVLFPTVARASTEPMYVIDSANHLMMVDVTTGQAELASGTMAHFTDIAFDPEGRLFGVTSRYLYEIEPESGWSRLVGHHGFAEPPGVYGIDALTFGWDGLLYAAGHDILITIDPETAVGAVLGDLSGYRSAGDMAVDASGRLLLTTDAGDLVEVFPDGSGARRIGSLGYDDVWAFAGNGDGGLYGIRSTNEIVSVDGITGTATPITYLTADFMIGRAYGGSFPDRAFVPEPATLLLLLTGLSVLTTCYGKRRRRRAAL